MYHLTGVLPTHLTIQNWVFETSYLQMKEFRDANLPKNVRNQFLLGSIGGAWEI
jgi:hypothetical protein